MENGRQRYRGGSVPGCVGECMRAQVFLHLPVMFKSECEVIFPTGVLFFHTLGQHLLVLCLKVLTPSIFLS